jgi:hypothetical protein
VQDWYGVRPEQLRELGGASLLGMFNSSLTRLLNDVSRDLYPSATTSPVAVSNSSYQTNNNNNGSTAVKTNSMLPEWKAWHFLNVPIGFWRNIHNQMAFIKDFEHISGITQHTHWYKVSVISFKKAGLPLFLCRPLHDTLSVCSKRNCDGTFAGGSMLLGLYGNSIYGIVTALYPQYQW